MDSLAYLEDTGLYTGEPHDCSKRPNIVMVGVSLLQQMHTSNLRNYNSCRSKSYIHNNYKINY